MKRNINDVDVEISAQEESEIRAEWDANAIEAKANELIKAKQDQKDALIKEKLESMLTVEFDEIDAATDKEAAKAVKLK